MELKKSEALAEEVAEEAISDHFRGPQNNGDF